MILASIPSPSSSYLQVGPLMLHGYALAALAGIAAAVWIGRRRWVARGGQAEDIVDIAVWAVPFGLVGGRVYHVLTDPELYFGLGRDPVTALYVWQGGLGIWGAIAGGAVGAYVGARRRGIRFPALADALAPAVAVGMGIGRIGCWFNQELYGGPTTLPWALQIDPAHRPAATPGVGLYHPTFLYELLWDFAVAALVIWADRRYRLGSGRAFALFVAGYTTGRAWIEALRVDPVNHLFGLRLNEWTSLLLLAAAVGYLIVTRSRADRQPYRPPTAPISPAPTSPAAKASRSPLDTSRPVDAATPAVKAGSGPLSDPSKTNPVGTTQTPTLEGHP